METSPLVVAGRLLEQGELRDVRDPYGDELVGHAWFAHAVHVEEALAAGSAAQHACANQPAFQRRQALLQVARRLEEELERFAQLICREAGKPITLARAEVMRAASTFACAAEESVRVAEKSVPLDVQPHGAGRFGVLRRFPRGLVAAITPFNFPLNLVAHKVAPALAYGCPVIVKPAPKTPLTALHLAALVQETELPREALQVLPADPEVADVLVTDPRVRVLSFTGSAQVGWGMRARAGHKHVALELGGDASVIVHEDADVAFAAHRIALGAFGYAGQVCIAVQHVLVHARVRTRFLEALLDAIGTHIVSGDPRDPRVVNGPLIDPLAADRVERWLDEAEEQGARRILRGRRDGRILLPSVLEEVPPSTSLGCEEVFGPVCTVSTYESLDDAIARVNQSRYGLQAGLFTDQLSTVWRAFEGLEVGGLIHNDAPTFRVDSMPYGGAKESGLGREGPAFVLDDFTERRLLALSPGRQGG